MLAQEYLPQAVEGDPRLFLMNGRPLEVDGKVAAFRRARSGGDLRSNIAAGGHAEPGLVGESARRIARLAGPRLVEDGMSGSIT